MEIETGEKSRERQRNNAAASAAAKECGSIKREHYKGSSNTYATDCCRAATGYC